MAYGSRQRKYRSVRPNLTNLFILILVRATKIKGDFFTARIDDSQGRTKRTDTPDSGVGFVLGNPMGSLTLYYHPENYENLRTCIHTMLRKYDLFRILTPVEPGGGGSIRVKPYFQTSCFFVFLEYTRFHPLPKIFCKQPKA